MKRPLYATILAIALGSGTVRILSSIGRQEFTPLTDPSVLFSLIELASGIVAGLAAVGIWRMRPWAYKAFGVFGVLFAGMFIYRDVAIENAGLLEVAGTTSLIAIFFMLMTRYVQSIMEERDADLSVHTD